MIDHGTYQRIKQEVKTRTATDSSLLEELRGDVRALRTSGRRIQPRSATTVSLVATDGGNNALRFDPFMVQIVRVVDSNDNELSLEVVTPTIADLEKRQFDPIGKPVSALGRLMDALGVRAPMACRKARPWCKYTVNLSSGRFCTIFSKKTMGQIRSLYSTEICAARRLQGSCSSSLGNYWKLTLSAMPVNGDRYSWSA